LRCRALWAGDSRGYVLTPDGGLAQLTRDHLRDPADAQRNLREDSPMSNAISAGEAFIIDSNTTEFVQPAIFLTATDGCFGYLASPAMFELMLLTTLATAQDIEGWRTALEHEISAVAADDASLALVAFGWSRLEDVKQAFAERLKRLDEMVRPIEQAQHRESEFRRELADRLSRAAAEVARHQVEDASAAVDRLRAQAEVAAAEALLAEAKFELSQKQLGAAEARVRVDGSPSGAENEEPDLIHAELGSIENDIKGCLASVEQAEHQLRDKKTALDAVRPHINRLPPAASDEQGRLNDVEAEVRATADEVWAIYREDYERYLKQPAKHRLEENAE
jgi:chromosome segregation ATPase